MGSPPLLTEGYYMKKLILYVFSLFMVCFFLAAMSIAAPPSWVTSRPVSAAYYIGIGMCLKKGHKDEYREIAKNEALYELASAISVEISASFVEKVIERTGMSERDIHMEIRSTTGARLTGYEMVAEWETRKEYWIYFKLSKKRYQQLLQLERERAVAAATDMLIRAGAERKKGSTVSALRFYFEALALVQDFVGENIQTEISGHPVILINEIYTSIQQIMADIKLSTKKNSIPALIGGALHEPLSVIATIEEEPTEERRISGLPIQFSLPWRESHQHKITVTDEKGIASYYFSSVSSLDDGRTVHASVDVNTLAPKKDSHGFFHAMIKKLTIPETSFRIRAFSNKDTYTWHREFEGKKVIVFSAYQTEDFLAEWLKVQDEIVTFIEGKGGNTLTKKGTPELKSILRWSANPNSEWQIDKVTDADFFFAIVASGKLNKRKNVNNPLGEDVQFAGEIRIAVHKAGQPYFSDRYRGVTGWNPMGKEMCMDVLAIHVVKRWKVKYLQHLTN